MVGRMTSNHEDHLKRTIQACRLAGLPVIDGADCTCSLRGRLVVLAREGSLQVVWPYHPHCPIHGPRERDAPAPGGSDSPGPLAVNAAAGGVEQVEGGRSTSLVSDVVRGLAAQLERRFGEDAELAGRLRDAQERLQSANERLWRGLHRDGIAAVYGEHAAVVDLARAENRSEVLGASDLLAALQQAHWRIRKVFSEYQAAAEARRQLAMETGETIRQFVDALMRAGWTETHARAANVRDLATTNELTRRN